MDKWAYAIGGAVRSGGRAKNLTKMFIFGQKLDENHQNSCLIGILSLNINVKVRV